MSVSFVIPARNEEKFIGNALSSINNPISSLNIADVVVIDNGSLDATATIARKHGATVFSIKEGSVGKLRNYGVSRTSGDVIIFIDADITLTDAWHKNISKVLQRFSTDSYLATGSHCHPPDESRLLERYWFSSFEGSTSSHLGTGHLIMTRELFNKVGGFAEDLMTGEDYNICMKVIAKGGYIEENKDLKVIHNDFPKNMFQFVMREAWHGMGDLVSFRSAIQSKVVIASIVFLLLNISLALSIIRLNSIAIAVNASLLFFYLFSVSHLKFRSRPLKVIFINAGVYFFYFTGRLLAIFKRLLGY